jgi:hypothetical protein
MPPSSAVSGVGDTFRRVALVLVIFGGACTPRISTIGEPGTGGAAGSGSGSGGSGPVLPPSTGGAPGQPTCGKQIEGPDIPCPDAARPAPAPDARPVDGPPAAPPTPPTPGGPIKVRAWGATFTGVYLRVGETAEITATGQWRAFGGIMTGPEGRAPNYRGCPRGALVARVAKFHQRTCIGARGRITAMREGFLWLYQSEGWNAMQSTGEIEATVTGGSRNVDKWQEGLTPISIDPRVEQARIQSFESVCGRGKLDVFFGAEEPNNPRVQAYVQQYFGGDPVGWISRALVRGCALFYATPAEWIRAWGNNRRGRLVHWIGNNEFPGPHQGGDFNLRKTLEEITSMQPDYGPFGGPPVSIMHEAGHWIAPDGGNGKLPKWLGETYAELLPSHIGDDRNGFHNAIDNPESVRFGATWWWCDGTFGGPTFFNWIDTQHPGFIHGVTKAAIDISRNRPWPSSDTVFRPLTGRSFEELVQGYSAAYDFAEYRPNKPVEQCLDPRE